MRDGRMYISRQQLARFVRTDNPLGDLARDWVAAKPDREPKTRTDMLNHLMSMRACPAALVTGRRAWAADAGR